MEHYNPLLPKDGNQKKFITIGEIMLRLTPPNYEKIRMASTFEASYGGSEANIALALANLGVDSTFFSVVPNNSLGKSAVRMLRSNDVHCTPVILSTVEETPTHRLGTYYLETGYGIRPSKVTYDRMHSAITEYNFDNYDIDSLLEGFDWLHLSGITPALGDNCRKLIMNCIKKAKEKGLIVSFDGNFRSQLWRRSSRLLHGVPALCRRSSRNRALSSLERRGRPLEGRLERRSSAPALLRGTGRRVLPFCRQVSEFKVHSASCTLCS